MNNIAVFSGLLLIFIVMAVFSIFEYRRAVAYNRERIEREKRIAGQLSILESSLESHCDAALCAHRLVEFNKDFRESMKKHIEAIDEGREYDF